MARIFQIVRFRWERTVIARVMLLDLDRGRTMTTQDLFRVLTELRLPIDDDDFEASRLRSILQNPKQELIE